jgi:pyridoxamine 5'-phosphate oxidase
MSITPSIVDDPIRLCAELLEAATRVDRALLPEPTAFALATATADGRPSVRILLLKKIDAAGFVFFTNIESRKGRELIANPWAAMCFHWQPLEIQVRAEGPVSQVSGEEADAYFASRPRGSQLGAWASAQSRPIATPGELDARLAAADRRFDGQVIPRPPYWTGFRLRPGRIEIWKNMPSRLHVRHLYQRDADGTPWRAETLYP